VELVSSCGRRSIVHRYVKFINIGHGSKQSGNTPACFFMLLVI
jgi:hypothetical protein